MTSSYTSSIPVPSGDYITNEDGATYCVTLVTQYDEDLPTILIPSSHKSPNIKEWFNDLLSRGSARLMMINGTPLGDDGGGEPFSENCNYCCNKIEGTYRRCIVDEMNMCDGCFTSHTIDPYTPRNLKGNETEKFKKWLAKRDREDEEDRDRRANLLEKCISHDLKEMKEKLTCRVCDASSLIVFGEWKKSTIGVVCGACCKLMKGPQTTRSKYCVLCDSNSTAETYFDLRNHDPKYNYNGGLCGGCVHTVNSSEEVVNVDPNDTYGSLMEWIPLIEDENNHTLLYNTAKNSPRYHNVALCPCDDHGRIAIHFIECTLEEAVTEMTNLDKEYQEKWPVGVHRNWKAHYTSPLCQMAQNRGKEVQFG